MDSSYGGLVGDAVATKLGLGLISIPLVIITIIALLYTFIFGNTAEDFNEAKVEKQQIVCEGLFKTYVFEANEYQVLNDKVVVKRLIKDKRFNLNDCSIKG